MDANIRNLLTSSEAADRLRGMEMLVKSEHPDTLKILHKLYKSDSDQSVRAQAAQLGKQLQSGSSTKPKKKAPRDPAGAQQALQAAEDDLFSLDYENAKKHAQRAFMLDPSLQHDEHAKTIAADITGTSPDVAVNALMQNADRPISSAVYAGLDSTPSRRQGEVGWGKAFLDISIYSGLYALIFLIAALGVAVAINGIFDALDVPFNAVPFAIGNTIVVFFAIAIYVMIWLGIVHFCATSLLKGKGYYTNLIHNVRNPLIVSLVVPAILGIIWVVSSLSLIGVGVDTATAFLNEIDYEYLVDVAESNDETALEIAIENELERASRVVQPSASEIDRLERGIEQAAGLGQILNIIQLVIAMGYLVWMSINIGKTYDFGAGSGCMSIILSVFAYVFVCGCGFCGLLFIS
ncbi:MAG: hypothetical protein AAFN11_05275 [Chloroflexota bacterium]